MALEHEDNHRYSRVVTHVPARLRRLESPHSQPLFSHHAGQVDSVDKSTLKSANLPEAMVDFLIALDRKIDTLLSLMSREMLETDFPLTLDVVEISGAGATLVTDLEFEPGEAVEIVLFLSQFPLRLVGAIGLVNRLPDKDETYDKPCYELTFSRIREQDKETVVRFVFQEERRNIREQKWD